MPGDQSESLEVLPKTAYQSPSDNASVPFVHVDSAPGTSYRRSQQQFFAFLVASANDAIVSKTLEGVITTWNRAATKLFGYSAEEAIGQHISLIIPPELRSEEDEILARLRQGLAIDHYETVRVTKDGRRVDVSLSISPIVDEQGAIIGAAKIARDITVQKAMARKLRAAEEQERFLTEVSKVLTSTLDYQETLANIAQLVVPRLADWFTVDLLDADGRFELVVVQHQDPAKVEWARALREKFPIDHTATSGAPQVMRTGQSELYADIPDELLVASARNEEELAIARQVGYSSAMIVPLVARGATTGVVTFVASESGRKYNERDLALAEEVGRRAGVALDNARLYTEVRQARHQLEIILEGVADGIVVYDRESRIIYANEAAAHLTGYASGRALQKTQPLEAANKYRLTDEQGQPFSLEQLPHRRVFAGERRAQTIIGYSLKPTGQPEHWSLVKSSPVYDEQGEVILVVTILHDVTERMQSEQRKDEFISMASHELKTPVTSLKGFTYVLQRRLSRQSDEQSLHYLARMDAQLDKLTKLVSDLLDISRMQTGKLELQKTMVDIDALVAETVENVQAATATHRIRIEGKAHANVFGDRDRLGQVLINLLTNATKYSPQASTVIVSVAREQERAVVRVRDFGIGVDEAHQQRIFERFYQVTDPQEKTYPGLGIGLHISKEIVEQHAGRIEVESRKGEGATFSVFLPLAR